MVCNVACAALPAAEVAHNNAATDLPPSATVASRSTSKSRKIEVTPGTWPQRIGAAIEPALGDVLAMEQSRLKLNLITIAQHAQISEFRYRTFDRGKGQPNLSTFI